MREHVGGNGISIGSYNPPHNGHIESFGEALEVFDVLHVIVRYNPGVDLVDWETKRSWFARINEELGGRLVIHKHMNERIKGKTYALEDFFDFMHDAERIIGAPVAGFHFGSDYQELLPEFEREFPSMHFLITDRSPVNGEVRSSTAIRNDLEGHRDSLPPYVYQTLHDLRERA